MAMLPTQASQILVQQGTDQSNTVKYSECDIPPVH